VTVVRTPVPAHAPTPATTRTFASPAAWRRWLARHHASSSGLWLRFFKKATGRQVLDHAGALEEALCWGWIDGQARPYDESSWLQRYSPRRPRSKWSKRNCEIAERLVRDGRMQPGGQAQLTAAKADGRWDAAYDSPANAVVPTAFFNTLNRTNRFAIAYRLQTAVKPETRQRRFAQLVEMIKARQRLH
jgi:uncharacterized protein YdeI (YjbR/CyaY-like superfamily)